MMIIINPHVHKLEGGMILPILQRRKAEAQRGEKSHGDTISNPCLYDTRPTQINVWSLKWLQSLSLPVSIQFTSSQTSFSAIIPFTQHKLSPKGIGPFPWLYRFPFSGPPCPGSGIWQPRTTFSASLWNGSAHISTPAIRPTWGHWGFSLLFSHNLPAWASLVTQW